MDVLEWAERLFQLRRRLNLDQQQMGNLLGVTREWVSKLENGKGEFSKAVRHVIERHERELTSQTSHVEEPQADYVKTRDNPAVSPPDAPVRFPPMVVDPRFAPKRLPSTKQDCETYFAELMKRAAASDNPNAFPAIMDRLKKKFPLDEWDEEE